MVYLVFMDDSVRQRLAKNEIMLSSLAEVRQHSEVLYRTADTELYCPHCIHAVIQKSFEPLEKHRCYNCKEVSTFIIWSKTQDGRNWKAALCSTN